LCIIVTLGASEAAKDGIVLARDAFIETNRRAVAMMFISPSVCLSGTGVHCDHTVRFSADLKQLYC